MSTNLEVCCICTSVFIYFRVIDLIIFVVGVGSGVAFILGDGSIFLDMFNHLYKCVISRFMWISDIMLCCVSQRTGEFMHTWVSTANTGWWLVPWSHFIRISFLEPLTHPVHIWKSRGIFNDFCNSVTQLTSNFWRHLRTRNSYKQIWVDFSTKVEWIGHEIWLDIVSSKPITYRQLFFFLSLISCKIWSGFN